MNKKKDHNQNLKDLLSKISSVKSEDVDEFDKSAMEGFAMLESEKEAIELKKALDTKIYAEVFTAEKRESRKLYWLAAAGLIGVIGFSIYLFQYYFVAKDDKLAFQQETTSFKNEKGEKAEASSDKKAFEEPKSKTSSENSKSKEAKKPEKRLTLEAEEDKDESPPKGYAEENTNTAETTPLAASETQREDMNSSELKNHKTIQSEKEVLPARSDSERSGVPLSVQEIKSHKKSEKEGMAYHEGAQDLDVQEADVISSSNAPRCYYDGGEAVLQKDLKEKLQSVNLVYKFDAILFLSKKAKIEKVTFINSYGLSSEVQNKLMEQLMRLSKFKVSGKLAKTERIEYRIEFRP